MSNKFKVGDRASIIGIIAFIIGSLWGAYLHGINYHPYKLESDLPKAIIGTSTPVDFELTYRVRSIEVKP